MMYILEFKSVTIEDEAHVYDVGLREVSLALRPGDLALVMLQRPWFRVPLADAAQGLAEPDRGQVLYKGRDWRSTLATRAARQRYRTGRVFEGHSWISNLDVDENVLLPSHHHASRSEEQLRSEADSLARRFGLADGLPRVRPAKATAEELRRSACVRAFLGEPELLLLERPAQTIHDAVRQPLIDAIAAARARGVAVLWLTSLAEAFDDEGFRPTVRYRMQGPALVPLAPAAAARGGADEPITPDERRPRDGSHV
jgi:phospholipid/cholesterol/gamma-HCH transport system ATP-binding protein